MTAPVRSERHGLPASITVRVVRGVWWNGRGLEVGEILEVPFRDGAAWIADGKAVRVVPAPETVHAGPVTADTAAPLVPRAREPVRRMRR